MVQFAIMVFITSVLAVPLCMLLPKSLRYYAMPSVFLSTFLPVLQDVYLSIFIWSINAGYQTLEEQVRSQTLWSQDYVTELATHWISLKKLLFFHNSIFRRTTFVRLILFTAQMMSYLVTITTYQQSSECLPLFVCTLIFMIELLHMGLAFALSEILHSPMLTDDVREPLQVLLTRVEAQPAEVEVWGMKRLGSSSMTRQLNIVISVFVLMLQLQPQYSIQDFVWPEGLSYFDRCYSPSSSG
ncbi:uncharacterized protein LOC125179084 [Hyalella azteca]|uniref:Uncharacterized protein LOC125179084 n=1 Tax=Hyalella azteca TaxID=294128 RepID=A0A979FSN9_HYAAZ|nr:uncharacterized protein LOC125179084 [Hyalella azteca]